ncbi:hypothetical protein BJY01DRAFT_142470 [Aspergillus pseudoustus]|uniref:Secreted protein n=1 Tax=Aspergillus pseudoustus TaxID=1810923 RepID=A0ABR4KBA5_9EURO
MRWRGTKRSSLVVMMAACSHTHLESGSGARGNPQRFHGTYSSRQPPLVFAPLEAPCSNIQLLHEKAARSLLQLHPTISPKQCLNSISRLEHWLRDLPLTE